ncbi:MAG: PAS domain S-box protein [Sphingobacteriales bacterium]|nr:MAG: PAS domain S-box protein [Sphingobacteriales bacterium]
MSVTAPQDFISPAELEAVVEASADVMFKISEAGKILSCRMGKFADPVWNADELLGKEVEHTVLGAHSVSFTKAFRHVMNGNGPQNLEYFVQVPDMKKWYEVRMVPSENQEVLAVFKDITTQKQAQEEKQHTEALFKAIFDNTYQFTALLSPEGTLLQINKTALEFGGTALEALQGQPFWEAPWWNVPVNTSTRLKAAIRSAAANNFVRYEAQVLGGDGNIYCLDFSLKAITDELGEVLFLIAEGRDITSRKKMEEELARSRKMYQTMAQNIPRGMLLVLNKALIVTMAEGEMLKLMDLSTEEVEGKALESLTPDEETYALLSGKYMAGFKGEASNFEFESPDGKVHYHVNVQPLYKDDKQIDEILVIVYDVQQQKAMEAQLQQNLQELQKTVKTLQQKNEQLEQFAYISSHDLQEPLRMVVSYTQLLERKLSGKIDEEAKEFMYFAREGAQRMQQIIYDLLLYNDLDNIKRQQQEINANLAVKNVIFKLQERIEKTQATVTCDPLPYIWAEPKEFALLIEHLVSNALKFTKPNQPPVIHISSSQTDTEWIFAVQDKGIGINANHFGRIFNIFQRLHNRNEYTGSGIGLAICKKIVNLHGGNIWVDSREDAGCTFYFSLPKPY